MIIPIHPDYYDTGNPLYKYNELDLKPGITSLVGCNGSGKTTLLHQINDYSNTHKVKCISYNDRLDGHSHLMGKLLWEDKTEDLANLVMSSEGERNYLGVGSFVQKVGRTIRECNKSSISDLIILLDATDSGMSIDNIEETREVFLDIIIPDAAQSNVSLYVVVASNNYEWVHDDRIATMNVVTGKYLRNLTYSMWKRCIKSTRSYKDKRVAD